MHFVLQLSVEFVVLYTVIASPTPLGFRNISNRVQSQSDFTEISSPADLNIGLEETQSKTAHKSVMSTFEYFDFEYADYKNLIQLPLIKSKYIDRLSEVRLERIFCNYNASSDKRTLSSKFTMDNINAAYCTDYNYDYAELNEHHLMSVSRINVLSIDRGIYVPKYVAFNGIKIDFTSLRTYLTIMESKEITFSSLVLNEGRGKAFVTSCVYNLRLWGFDGLNVKWLHPSNPSYLTQLLINLRNAFEMDFNIQKKGVNRLLLGVILSGQTGVASEKYQVHAISSLVDIITLQIFDDSPVYNRTTLMTSTLFDTGINFTEVGDSGIIQEISMNTTSLNISVPTNHSINTTGVNNNMSTVNSSSHSKGNTANINNVTVNLSSHSEGNNTNVNNFTVSASQNIAMGTQEFKAGIKQFIISETINEWLSLGVDKSKLIGQGFILKDKSRNDLGAPVSGPSSPRSSNIPGQYCFYEMCQLTKQGNVQRVSKYDQTPYWYNDDTWVSYEDIDSLQQKIEYIKHKYVHGVMIFSQSEDDFFGTSCGLGSFPVSELIYNVSKVAGNAYIPRGKADWVDFCDGSAAATATTSCLLMMITVIAMLFYFI